MLNFEALVMNDRDRVRPFLNQPNMLGTQNCFETTYIWEQTYQDQICIEGNWLYFYSPLSQVFSCPVAKDGSMDYREPISKMAEFARANHVPVVIWGVQAEQQAELERYFPGMFRFESDRDDYDYVYSVEKLTTLSGKHLHGKRNHINKFIDLYPDWTFEPISDQNIDDAFSMHVAWCREHDAETNEDLMEEYKAVRRCFQNFHELGMYGGLIRAGGRAVAYSMAAKVGTECADVLFEKAYSDIPGAYTIMNREMAIYLSQSIPGLRWINREEDKGEEGLRKAKLSYVPDILLEKATAYLGPEKEALL